MHCHNCQTESTPMWRRTLDAQTDTIVTLCNACGLYYKTKGAHRPTVLISKKNSLSTTELLDKLIQTKRPEDNRLIVKDLNLKDLNIIHCANCQNINTSIWRKDDQGRNICNACGLYYKKKGIHRVVKASKLTNDKDVFLEIDDNLIRFNRIKRRKRSSAEIVEEKLKPHIYMERSTSVSSASSSAIVEDSPRSITKSITPPLVPVRELQLLHSVNSPVTPATTTPLVAPFTMIPDNYRLTSSSVSFGIDQYHYDHTFPALREHNTATSFARSGSFSQPQNKESRVQLPPISSILRI